MPQATAYNLFFEGFENQTQLSKFWYPSVIKGWEGRFSTNTTLGGGAEHFEDHGLFFHDEDMRYGMYQPFNAEVKYRPLNYKLDYNPMFNMTVVSLCYAYDKLQVCTSACVCARMCVCASWGCVPTCSFG